MLKLVYIVRRRADFLPKDFYQRWLTHGPLVRDLAEAIHARRYIQSHTIEAPLNEQFAQSRGMPVWIDFPGARLTRPVIAQRFGYNCNRNGFNCKQPA